MRVGVTLPGKEVPGQLGRVSALEAGNSDDVPAPEVAQPDGVFWADDVPVLFHIGHGMRGCGPVNVTILLSRVLRA